jgi:hydroxyacylglutathione hydrolase
MKKLVKVSLIGLATVIGIVLVIFLIFGIRFFNETKKMTPAETGKLNDSVYCIKDKFVNAFLFKEKEGFLLVDAGFNAKGFNRELEKLRIKPEQINAVLLTHTDGDHIGAIGLFTQAKVYMHQEEEQMINGKNGKFFFSKKKWKFGPYTLLKSNDTLTISGLKIQIIHIPGHTPGSACYLIDDKYLATGDNISFKNGHIGPFNNYFNMNTKEQIKSIKAHKKIFCNRYLLTGHYGIIPPMHD